MISDTLKDNIPRCPIRCPISCRSDTLSDSGDGTASPSDKAFLMPRIQPAQGPALIPAPAPGERCRRQGGRSAGLGAEPIEGDILAEGLHGDDVDFGGVGHFWT